MAWYKKYKIMCPQCGEEMTLYHIDSWEYENRKNIAKVKVTYICTKCGTVITTETLL